MWNILVVDDEVDNRELLLAILEDHAECSTANSGTEALDVFCRALDSGKSFDAVLLDVAMPDKDGIQVLNEIRRIEERRGVMLGEGTPVIMVTAHPRTFMKSFIGGADEFVTKPVDGDKLLQLLTNRLNSRTKKSA